METVCSTISVGVLNCSQVYSPPVESGYSWLLQIPLILVILGLGIIILAGITNVKNDEYGKA